MMAVRTTRASDPDSDGLPALQQGQRPIRTCIGCRRRAAATELLRVVVASGTTPTQVVPDPRRRAPGRGAWLHPVAECVDLAERRRAFARALRDPGPIDASPVREFLVTSDPVTQNRAEPRRS